MRDLFWLVIIALVVSFGRAITDVVEVGEWPSLLPRAASSPLLQAWVSAVLGIIIVLPIFAFTRREVGPGPRLLSFEAFAASGLLATLLIVILPPDTADPFRYFYLLFVPQIWLSVRFGVRGAVAANVVVLVVLIALFSLNPAYGDEAFHYQFRLLALASSALFLGVSVSERRDVEAALRQRQSELAHVARLSLAGEMAAALAHELNQPLQASIAFTKSARRLLSASGPAQDVITVMDEAVAQSERAGNIIKALRRFVGGAPSARKVESFSTIVRNAVALTQSECSRARVRLKVDLASSLPKLVVDAVQIEQVLVNLVQNAVNSLGSVPGLREIEIHASRAQGLFLEVAVRDTGDGLPSEVAARIFDPLIRGETPGGLGLGLVVTRGLIEAHGGRLWLACNEPGHCAFHFTLPVAGK